jgi:hypothetical protein
LPGDVTAVSSARRTLPPTRSSASIGRLQEPAAVTLPTLPARLARVFALLALLAAGGATIAADRELIAAIQASEFGVARTLPAPPPSVAELKFREFFRMPVGPRGLEPSERLLALDGKKVRIVGFMVQQELPAPGRFILAPMPIQMSDDEDGLADDLPPNVVFVHYQAPGDAPLPFLPGLLQFTGTLEVGALDEGDGRVSTVRLRLDAPASEALVRLGSLR